ncbi:MAG: PAS domain S-box protein [Phycisphaerae bacterium]
MNARSDQRGDGLPSDAPAANQNAGKPGDAVLVADLEGRVLYVSQNRDGNGSDASRLLGKRIDEILPARYVPEASTLEIIRSAVEDGRWVGETLHDLSGTERRRHLVVYPLRGEDGKVSAVVGFSTNLAARDVALQSLRDSEQRFHSLLAAIPDIIMVLDTEGVYRRVYTAEEDLLAAPAEKMIGKPMHDLVPANVAEAALAAVRRALETGEVQSFEYELQLGAEQHVFSARIGPFVYEDRPATIFVVRDVTEARRAEEALRRSERELRLTFDEAPIGAAVADLDVTFRRVNAELCRITGYDEDELVGMPSSQLTHPDDREVSRAEARRLIAGEIDQYQMDKRYVRKDGSVLWVSVSVRLVRGEDDTPLYLLAMMEDITDRKEAQAALRQQEVQLRNATKMEAIGRLAGGIAHDFNNQLTVVKGYSDLLLRSVDREDPNYEALLEIRSAAERAANLTNQLLVFGRKRALQPRVLNLNDILREMRGPLGRMLGEDIRLEVINDGNLGNVEIDQSQLQQMIVNLVVNARDAVGDSGRIVLETANVSLTPDQLPADSSLRPGPFIMFAVSDTGRGMDEETRRNIFEPFYTTKPQGEGTGLGLAMVYGLVHASGGFVEVDSTPGQGSRFRIFLPPSEQDVAEPEPQKPVETAAGGQTVLLVEDDESVRHVLVRELRGTGFTVLEAADAREALPLGQHYEGPIEVLVTDVVMPGLKGPELARRLLKARPHLRVLYISGYAETAVYTDEGDPGVSLLRKPFSPRQLSQAVQDILKQPGRKKR